MPWRCWPSSAGCPITGCDNDTSGAADLEALGVPVWQGHDPAHVDDARAVVVTAAVPADHPELARAQAQGLAVMRRADALGVVVAGATVVAVAGTHGKTTTTAMCTQALAAAGRDPTGLVGGRIAAWGGNARIGGTSLYVVEADEFDKAFLSLAPTVAVINNVEADHLECYGGSTEALERAFVQFATPRGARDRRQRRSRRRPRRRGAAGAGVAGGDGVGRRYPHQRRRSRTGRLARARRPAGRPRRCTLRLRVPGLHNVRNAAAALGGGRRARCGARARGGGAGVVHRRGAALRARGGGGGRDDRGRLRAPSERSPGDARRGAAGISADAAWSRSSSRTCIPAPRCTARRWGESSRRRTSSFSRRSTRRASSRSPA